MRPRDPIDAALCDVLARKAAAGDEKAWQQLAGHLWPACLRIVGKSRALRRFGASEDRVRDVVTDLFGNLGGNGAHGLQLYTRWRERSPDKTFADWLRIVLANAVRDHVRDHADESVGAEAGRAEPSVNWLLNEFARSGAVEEIGERPAVTAAQTARQLLAYAQRHLPPDQHRALLLWLDGGRFEEIAGEAGDAEAAKKLLRAAVAVLRRQFAAGE